MNTEDFHNHIQKRGHKDKESCAKPQIENCPNDANGVGCNRPFNIDISDVYHNGYEHTNLSKRNSIDFNLSHPDSKPQAAITTGINLMPDVNIGIVGDFKEEFLMANAKHTNEKLDAIRKFRLNNVGVSSHSATVKELPNGMHIRKILQAIPPTMADLSFRMARQCFNEIEIVALLTQYVNIFDSNLEIKPFGSRLFGFGGSKTDFNVLVNGSHANQNPNIAFQKFKRIFKMLGVQNDFKILATINGDRVQKRRLQAIHKASGILCRIQFVTDFEMAQSSQIIRNFIMHEPICEYLIETFDGLL